MRRTLILLVGLATLCLASRAGAAWSPDGNPVVRTPSDQHGVVALPFGDGGVLVAWVDYDADSNHHGLYASALTSDGELVPGWPEGGLPLCRASQGRHSLSVVDDGQGGAVFSWIDARDPNEAIYVQRVTAAGTIAPGWPEDGVYVAEHSYGPEGHGLASDGAGGVFASWVAHSGDERSLRVTRLTGAGERAPEWSSDGVSIGRGFGGPLLSDGAGGVFVGWIDWDYPDPGTRLVIRRVTADAVPHPDWPWEGTQISDEYGLGWVLLPDGAGGVIAGWTRPWVCPLDWECWVPGRAAHVEASGQRAPDWPVNGLDIGPSRAIAPDGAGGVLNAWVRSSTRVTRVTGDGTRPPGWAQEGNPACSEESPQVSPAIAGDGTGGAFVMWIDYRSGSPVLYQTRMTATGERAPGWPATGSLAAPAAVQPEEPLLVTTGTGRAIGVWVDARHGSRDVFAKEALPGPAGPPAPRPDPFSLAIQSLMPNPSRGTVSILMTLPSASPATLDVIDLAGRVVSSRRVDPAGPGPRTLTFDTSAPASGLYWLSLRQDGRRASARVMVVR